MTLREQDEEAQRKLDELQRHSDSVLRRATKVVADTKTQRLQDAVNQTGDALRANQRGHLWTR